MVDASPLGRHVAISSRRAIKAEIARLDWEIASANAAERNALEKQRDKLATGFDDRVLTLRVLDPAMGSGHFLIRAQSASILRKRSRPIRTQRSRKRRKTAWRGVDCFLEAARRRELPLWG